MRSFARASIVLGLVVTLAGGTPLRAQDCDVYSVRRINGVDAQARYGIGHGSGVLFLSSVTMRAKSPN